MHTLINMKKKLFNVNFFRSLNPLRRVVYKKISAKLATDLTFQMEYKSCVLLKRNQFLKGLETKGTRLFFSFSR